MAEWEWRRSLVHSAAMLAFAALASGCVTARAPVVLNASFDAQGAAFINVEGRARVSGQAFVRRNDGSLLRAVGTDVFLVPRTAYADERIAAIYGSGKQPLASVRMPEADPLYDQYMRKTIASSGGSFSFERVADGEYYVIAMIYLPSEAMPMHLPILERVTVQGGRSVRIVMRGY